MPAVQMFVVLGPGSFLAFGDIMCAVAAVVFAALWYIGSRTPRHIGKRPRNQPFGLGLEVVVFVITARLVKT